MNTEHTTTQSQASAEDAQEYSGTATYCPEDNKLRLYVGRVPRDEYLKLRAEGWTSTPKQTCDFVATWAPTRRDTALQYAGLIEDEDQSPEERAADRAERFGDYRDKRTGEATGHADRYDAGPAVHGFQSQSRAERSARRHDLVADRAGDAWGKAEYWQRRTAGVISHALHLAKPGVRMGRIKTLEAELRGVLARWNCPREEITQQGAIDWINHLELRIAYENQMLDAQGGRLEQCEVLAGGKLGGRLILKVSKSTVTGRATSADVIGPKVQGWVYKTTNIHGTEFAAYKFDLERMAPDAYTPPTPESLAELAAFKASVKAAAPVLPPCPLINPTDADAERLQAIWNARALEAREASYKRQGYSLPVTDCEPQTVLRTSQATYSKASQGSYSSAQTRPIFAGGIECASYYNAAEKMRAEHGRPICQVRRTGGGNYSASRVIILTDKPQKPLPSAVWPAKKPIIAALVAASESFALEAQ